MSLSVVRQTCVSAVAAVCITALTSCGASIGAVYEGDVRFEHCMALDARPEVKPTIRRACWDEWLKFYTFGQNRDRVDWARIRIKQLHMASDFDEGEWSPPKRVAAAAPEPTSALAPPPMTLGTATDGGVPKSTSDGGAGDEDKPGPGSKCASDCDDSLNLCQRDCKTPGCEKACSAKYKQCMRKCR